MQLAEHSVRREAETTHIGEALLGHCRTKAPATQAKDDIDMEDSSAARAKVATHNWREAYAEWKARVYNMEQNSGIVPGAKQRRVLEVIHERCVLEECHDDGQASERCLALFMDCRGPENHNSWCGYVPTSRMCGAGWKGESSATSHH